MLANVKEVCYSVFALQLNTTMAFCCLLNIIVGTCAVAMFGDDTTVRMELITAAVGLAPPCYIGTNHGMRASSIPVTGCSHATQKYVHTN
jgi:hypothetical protein